MKPFDLEAAKRGDPIVTRDGRKVTFVGHIPEAGPTFRVLAFIEGNDRATTYYECGAYTKINQTSIDLFMGTRKRTVYVNLWPISECYGNALWYDSIDEARNANTGAFATAMPVEIED